jgi:hypothetical protein
MSQNDLIPNVSLEAPLPAGPSRPIFRARGHGLHRVAFAATALAGLLAGASIVVGLADDAQAEGMTAAPGPQYTSTGELKLPTDFRRWVFLGSPLTPNALNNGKAGFPEYHNVYVQHHAYEAYRKSGEFPEGTILVKELQLTAPGQHSDGSRNEASGRGYFPATLNGIDISVRDSKRFKDTNGWGFFNFGHHAPPYAKTAAAQPKAACAGCHEANATNMVFSKFYEPILKAQ